MYKENNKGPRTVPCGTAANTGSNLILHRLQEFTVVCRKERMYPFQCLPTYATARQFAKQVVRWSAKCFLKIENKCINLSSIVQDFSPIIYYSSQLSITTVTFSKCMLSI